LNSGSGGALERAIDDQSTALGPTRPRNGARMRIKDPSRRADRTNVTQIVDHARTDVRRQRQSPQSLALAADDNLTALQSRSSKVKATTSPARNPRQARNNKIA